MKLAFCSGIFKLKIGQKADPIYQWFYFHPIIIGRDLNAISKS